MLGDAGACCGAVAARSSVRLAVLFHQNGVVDVASERRVNGLEVRLVAVGRELNSVAQARRNVLHEDMRVASVASADQVADDAWD